jgi:putative peptidoglycan lipid II flippase
VSPAARRTVVGAAGGVVSAAALIGVVTLFSRLFGFLRQVVFTNAVDVSCLNTAYTTANALPRIVFEIVAGGALVASVVPVLAGSVARGDNERVRQTASALLMWTVGVLIPVALVGALLAGPLIGLLLGDGGGCADQRALVVEVATRMLVVFTVQIPVLGICVVLTGILQAHHRFLAPAFAPLVSSLVIIGAYLAYAAMAGDDRGEIEALTRSEELVLSVGTTLGAVALALALVPSTARLRLGLRPTLRFPTGVARRVVLLSSAALATVVAQQLVTALVIRLANDRGDAGAVGVYTLAWTVYLLPWAVLAVPLATSAFPRLVARHDAGDSDGYAALTASVSRGVVVVSSLAAAFLVAAADPVANVLGFDLSQASDIEALARSIAAFAPALIGYGLLAHLTRSLYARGEGRAATVAVVTGWLVVAVTSLWWARAVVSADVVPALGLAMTTGMTVSGLLLLLAVRRSAGPSTTAGFVRTLAASLCAAVVAVLVGRAIVALADLGDSAWSALVLTGLVGVVVLGLGLAVLAILDREDLVRLLRPVLDRVRRA